MLLTACRQGVGGSCERGKERIRERERAREKEIKFWEPHTLRE